MKSRSPPLTGLPSVAAKQGPIVKNKVFVFGDYQGTREVRGVSSGLINVPSALEKTGDFSDLDTTGFEAFSGLVRGDDANPDDPNNFPAVLSNRLGYPVVLDERTGIRHARVAMLHLEVVCFPERMDRSFLNPLGRRWPLPPSSFCQIRTGVKAERQHSLPRRKNSICGTTSLG